MICQQCGGAEYVLERYQSGAAVGALGAIPVHATRWRCPKCSDTVDRLPGDGPRLNPIAQALLGRLAQTAVRAGVRGLGAAADSVAEEGEELLEQLGQKAIDFGKKIRDARTKRGGG
jgi:hypothetical protein